MHNRYPFPRLYEAYQDSTGVSTPSAIHALTRRPRALAAASRTGCRAGRSRCLWHLSLFTVTQPLCNCANVLDMKNITVSVPDEVYRVARIRAAEQGRSVSALVAEFLEGLSGQDAEFARLEALQRRVQAEVTRFRGGDRVGRDELHDRAVR